MEAVPCALLVGGGFLGGLRALVTRGAGIDAQPDDALGGLLLLQVLHGVAVVKLVDEGTLRVGPFQHDELALVLGEGVRLAVGALQREVGDGLAEGGVSGAGRGREETGGENKGGEGKKIFHGRGKT